MAVTPAQIKARLKVKYPKANLSQKRLDAIAAKLAPKPEDGADDDAIDAVLEAANDFMSFEDIAREDDRVRTLEANQKPKADPPAPAPTDPAAPEKVNTEEVPAWAKTLLDNNQKMAADIEAFKLGKITEDKRNTASQMLDGSEILKGLKPEIKKKWLERINVESETSLEDQIKDLETEYSDLVQISADSGSYSGAAGSGSNDVKPDEKVVEDIVSNLNI
ncbi:hypothetical protein [Flavobacterium anhuiense]|uniref:hypothetical protein n=1 Tax=Flavobacterium anhuiense TaxID=459526 RepID=UPI0020270685|nr:hypothetical protein [Flavobacterium anhuiense]URM37145.1 hypothetical protein LLY39_00700 [Flavobacterium anhuiense]